uniref:DSP-PTPase phosphatase fused to NAD+ Kinase domain-containing protein n=1 Tax=Oryza meridionalis TaxID=40149 RepID=A0A0E0DEI6_9ORYZ
MRYSVAAAALLPAVAARPRWRLLWRVRVEAAASRASARAWWGGGGGGGCGSAAPPPDPLRVTASLVYAVAANSVPFPVATAFFSFPSDLSQLLWVGPVSEIEAYCHIFRAAEQLHAASRRHSVIQLQGECPVHYDVQAVNLPVLEAKVTAVLAWMLALRNQGQKEVLSGLSGVASAFQGSEDSTMERIPTLTLFRGKRRCESMRVALANYLVPSEAQWLDIWRMLQRLKMPDMIQVSQGLMVIPVQRYFQIGFRGVQLEWLLSKGFKIIVDLWEEDVKDDLYLSAVQEAVSLGKIEVVNIPVEIGTAPSAKQVQRFTEVVSDSVKKPIYLHCQEGNEVVNIPVEIGTAPSAKQVQRFTEVVSDSVKKPIYLHCQEGNGRTSMMVSRWKQCWATQNGSLNGNEVYPKVLSKHNRSTEQGELHGTKTELQSNFSLESNPLEAQFPS